VSALTGIAQMDRELPAYLAQIGRIFDLFDQHDSGCTSCEDE
jgi:hypothetical protein